MTLAAVSDTGPLIHLAEIDAIDLLSVFDELSIPETVYEELERGGVPDGLTELSCELVEADETARPADDLDPGERAALTVASGRDAILLTDDLAARNAASREDVEVRGSIGVIALGHNRGELDTDGAVSRMRALQRETSLFVTNAVVERGIEMLED